MKAREDLADRLDEVRTDMISKDEHAACPSNVPFRCFRFSLIQEVRKRRMTEARITFIVDELVDEMRDHVRNGVRAGFASVRADLLAITAELSAIDSEIVKIKATLAEIHENVQTSKTEAEATEAGLEAIKPKLKIIAAISSNKSIENIGLDAGAAAISSMNAIDNVVDGFRLSF